MIFVDDRAGSKELAEPLRKLGLEVELTRLEFGDLMFEGRGEKGTSVLVGIEFKELRECVQAFRTERLQGLQAIGMRDTYQFPYLLIQGEVAFDKKGFLQKRVGRNDFAPMEGHMTINELYKRLNVMQLCMGIHYEICKSQTLTLQWILSLYRTFTDVDLDKHKSHIAIYQPPAPVYMSEMRRTLRTLPHIGNKASLAVEQHFEGSLAMAACADVDEWAQIETVSDDGKSKRRLGTKVAREIVDYCRGEHYKPRK